VTKIIVAIFIVLLLFSPLAFGTVEPWSIALMEAATFFALFLLLFQKVRRKETALYEIPGIIPLFCFLVYIIIQLIPLPSGIIRIFSPETYVLYQETLSFGKPIHWMSLSINHKSTVAEFFRIASYAAFYILTVQVLTDRTLLKKVVTVVVVFASLLSFFGILQHILSNNKINNLIN